MLILKLAFYVSQIHTIKLYFQTFLHNSTKYCPQIICTLPLLHISVTSLMLLSSVETEDIGGEDLNVVK